jgi:hypothetical protein
MVIGVTVWTAAATFEPSAGAAVVVVVAAVVGVVTLDCRTTVRAPSVELVDWDGGGGVGGVTVLGPRTGWVVVVVVVAVGTVDLLWWGFAGSSGAAALPSVGFG